MFKGKAIYQPKGKAGEYAEYACNFYVGCSNGCEYCYCKKGRGASILGGDRPALKKCFQDEYHAFEVFEKEFKANLPELQKHGIFFSFTTDPMLDATKNLTMEAVMFCVRNNVPVKILTKIAFDTYWFRAHFEPLYDKSKVAVGFTLTGHDELEPGASTNAERIDAMRKLHEACFKTFASIEPIIDFESSLRMIMESELHCDLFKIGTMSGGTYNRHTAELFVYCVSTTVPKPIYFKDSILKVSRIDRNRLGDNCVSKDYNIFNQ